MSLINRKKNVFNNISSIRSFNENNRSTRTNNTLTSLNKDKNSLSFLLDLLVVLIGSVGLIKILGNLFGNVFDNSKPLIIDDLKKDTISPLSNNQIINTNFNNGIILPVNYIDPYSKLKTNPNSDIGNLIYGNEYTNSFDLGLYDAINNPNTQYNIDNINVEYNDVDDTLLIQANNTNEIVNDFYDDYLNSDNIISKNEFVTNIMNNLFGTKNINQNKNINKNIRELKLKKILEKIINEETNIILSPTEINNIEEVSKQLTNGEINVDWGCGYFKSELSLNDLTDSINIINDADINTISNEFSNLFNKTYNSDNNVDTAKDQYTKNIINNFELELVNSFYLTPKILIMNYINQLIVDGEINENLEENITNNYENINCLSNTCKNIINEEIFNVVKKELTSLIIPFSKQLAKEKLNQYSGILRSLSGFI